MKSNFVIIIYLLSTQNYHTTTISATQQACCLQVSLSFNLEFQCQLCAFVPVDSQAQLSLTKRRKDSVDSADRQTNNPKGRLITNTKQQH